MQVSLDTDGGKPTDTQGDQGSPTRPARRRFAVRGAQVVTGLLVVIYLASTIFRAHHVTSTLYDGWIGNLGYGGCALLCVWRAITVPRHRLAWSAIALSLVLFTMGAVLWTTLVQYYRPVPYPSVSDLCFLAFYPVAYAGVGMLVRESIGHGARAIWLDGLIAASGIAALEAAIVIAPISHGDKGSFATVATNLAYPIGDLVLVAMLVALFVMRAFRPGRMWWMLGIGLVIFAVADSIYVLRVTSGTYVTGTPLDSLWLIGTFLIASAAWVHRGIDRPGTLPQMPIVVPALFLLSSLGIVVYGTFARVLPLAVFLATGTLLAAVGRMAHAYRQLRVLAETRREARTDQLTGLANRRAFYESLQEALDPGAGHQRLAVLMVDLDRFKEINDSLGHRVGDEVLRQIAPLLSQAAAGIGTVARLGGDEFGLLLSPLGDPSVAMLLAEQIREALRRQVRLDDVTLSVDASIGIAISPDDGADADILLQKADVAMYEAKQSHQTCEFYSQARDVHSRERLELMSEMRDAIDHGELVVHYQPKLDLATSSVTGVEALVRWMHPTRGLLYPDRFIPLAEQSGLMGPVAMSVLDQALAQQLRWGRDGIDISVAVNLSVTNLRDEGLPDRVADALSRSGVDPRSLILEITEDCVMSDAEQGRHVLEELRALGVELSVDDFGTGFSSLVYLRHLPVSELKLDRLFLSDVREDSRAVAIIRSTVELAHALGLRIIAEGIETADSLALVTRLGCDTGQGYFLGRPVPAAELSLDRVALPAAS